MDVLEARFPARATAKSLYIAGSFFLSGAAGREERKYCGRRPGLFIVAADPNEPGFMAWW